jgi:hypothetical protein
MGNVEVLLVGKTREWETLEYAADAVSEGKKKTLIIIGHVPSGKAGMEECARWLKTFVKNVPIEFVPTKQLFGLWRQESAAWSSISSASAVPQRNASNRSRNFRTLLGF